MKNKIFTAVLLALLIAGCNNASESTETTSTDSSARIEVSADTISGTRDIPELDTVSFLPEGSPDEESTDSKKELAKQVKNLLEFFVNDSMKVDTTYIATLAMAKNTSSAELRVNIAHLIDTNSSVIVSDTTQEIKLKMAATLEDKAASQNPNFDIKRLATESPIRTYDAKKNKMVWQWNVTPLKEGTHELILSISEVDENDKLIGSPETRRYHIKIMSEKVRPGFGTQISKFIADYWQWLFGSLLIPIFLIWFSNKNKKEKK